MIQVEYLKNYPMFGGISEQALAHIRKMLSCQHFLADHTIVKQGDQEDRVYFILHGKVGIYVDNMRIYELDEGEQFGEMHMIDIMPRSASVVTESEVTTVSLSKKEFLKIKNYDEETFLLLVWNCGRTISRRLRIMNTRFAELGKQFHKSNTPKKKR